MPAVRWMGQGSSDLRYASEGPPPAGWRRQVCERTSFPRAATCWRVHVECAVVISVIPVPHRVGKGLTELSPALKHRCFDLFGSYGSTGVWVMPPGLRTSPHVCVRLAWPQLRDKDVVWGLRRVWARGGHGLMGELYVMGTLGASPEVEGRLDGRGRCRGNGRGEKI